MSKTKNTKKSEKSERPTKKRKSFLDALIRTLLLGQREMVDYMEDMEEEQVQSPFSKMAKAFFSRRLTQIGLIAFFLIFAMCWIYPLINPFDVLFTDAGMTHQPPGINMMRVPRALQNNIDHISAGAGFGIGLSNDGQVYTWGNTRAMGLDDVPQPGSRSGRVVQVSAGLNHAVMLTENGYVYTWGQREFRLPNIPPEIQGRTVFVQAGFQVSGAITDDGVIHAWGNPNLVGAVRNISPQHLDGFANYFVFNRFSMVALVEGGYVQHLSRIEQVYSNIPESVQGRTVDIAFTNHNGAALLDDGTVVVWGWSTAPALTETPAHIQGRTVAIDAGQGHFVALLDDGTVASWGNDYYNQASAPNLSNIVMVYTGAHHNFAIDANGRAHTWGLAGFLMGTDHQGRDVFGRILTAGRVTMTVGAIAVVISTFIGLLLGGLAGYFRGKVDMFIMRFSEAWSAIPFIPFAIMLSYTIGGRMGELGRLIVIMVVLGVLSWPPLMRLVRGQILQARENEYVTAARALGVGELRIIFKHIFPNILAVVTVSVAVSLATSMLTEATLSFLGFGVIEPRPTWGNMLFGVLQSTVIRDFWWRWVFPALAMGISVLSINIIGDGLREAIDPKSQGR